MRNSYSQIFGRQSGVTERFKLFSSPLLIAVVHSTGLPGELVTQMFIGVASAIFPPAIAAISLGIVGHAQLSRRIGRNESFNHAGNVTFALLAGAVGTWVAPSWMFYASALIATGTVCSALAIRSGDIDNMVARGATGRESERG